MILTEFKFEFGFIIKKKLRKSLFSTYLLETELITKKDDDDND